MCDEIIAALEELKLHCLYTTCQNCNFNTEEGCIFNAGKPFNWDLPTIEEEGDSNDL